jgi:hypothetical protein
VWEAQKWNNIPENFSGIEETPDKQDCHNQTSGDTQSWTQLLSKDSVTKFHYKLSNASLQNSLDFKRQSSEKNYSHICSKSWGNNNLPEKISTFQTIKEIYNAISRTLRKLNEN